MVAICSTSITFQIRQLDVNCKDVVLKGMSGTKRVLSEYWCTECVPGFLDIRCWRDISVVSRRVQYSI